MYRLVNLIICLSLLLGCSATDLSNINHAAPGNDADRLVQHERMSVDSAHWHITVTKLSHYSNVRLHKNSLVALSIPMKDDEGPVCMSLSSDQATSFVESIEAGSNAHKLCFILLAGMEQPNFMTVLSPDTSTEGVSSFFVHLKEYIDESSLVSCLVIWGEVSYEVTIRRSN